MGGARTRLEAWPGFRVQNPELWVQVGIRTAVGIRNAVFQIGGGHSRNDFLLLPLLRI